MKKLMSLPSVKPLCAPYSASVYLDFNIYIYIYISILTAICQVDLGFIGAKDENWSYKTYKTRSKHHQQQTNTHVFAGQMPFLLPNQHRQSTD